MRYTPKKPIQINRKQPQKRAPKHVDQLQIKSSNVPLSPFKHNEDVLKSIKHLLDTQWDPITMLNPDFQAHLVKHRNLTPRVIIKNQLYSMHLNESSFIDQEIVKLIRKNELVSLRNENDIIASDLIIRKQDYLDRIAGLLSDLTIHEDIVSVKKFNEYIIKKQISIVQTEKLEKDGFTEQDRSKLVNFGFLRLVMGDAKSLALSIPDYGSIINLLRLSKTFIMKIIIGTKWKEIPLKELKDKWNKYKLRFKDLKGLTINWPLHYLIGSGQIELSETLNGEKCIKLIK